jgi:hypothetical protein
LKLVQNFGVVGILLSVDWQAVETADGIFDRTQVDSRLQEAAACGLAVEMSLVIGLWHTPDWLLDPASGIQTIGLINQNKYQADCGASHVTPVYWDPTLQSYVIRVERHRAGRLCCLADFGRSPADSCLFDVPPQAPFGERRRIIDCGGAALLSSIQRVSG